MSRGTIESRLAEYRAKLEARVTRPEGQLSRAERIKVMRAKVRAWNGTPAPSSVAVRSGGALGSPPSPSGRRLFSEHTAGEEFEYWLVDLGVRAVLVPGGALITGGDRAWRCEVVGT